MKTEENRENLSKQRMKIIGVSRGKRYSPNHVGNDAAIYNKVLETLRASGFSVESYTEEEFWTLPLPDGEVTVVDMARDVRTLSRLHEWEQMGVLVVNSPRGIEQCVRRPMTERLLAHGVPHPESWIVETARDLPDGLTFPCWVKRGESHAVVKEDVCYATSSEEVRRILADFRERNIPTAVINAHLQGDLVKFYGVQDSPFFYWFYPSPCSHSKFGLEEINGVAKGYAFDETILKQCADEAAAVLDVPVYGGDAVVMPDGMIKLIDFNDWPSFAPCREEAGVAIARYVEERIKIANNERN